MQYINTTNLQNTCFGLIKNNYELIFNYIVRDLDIYL
jgi:hypothetical protein